YTRSSFTPISRVPKCPISADTLHKQALGSVAGIVGAGGNAGAVAFGFLFRTESLSTEAALFYLGIVVAAAATLIFFIRFSEESKSEERLAMRQALVAHRAVLVAVAVDDRD
ncbi:MAG: hypothetical protein O2783_07445, partial [Chloroflexi bacterium]|nr:hypothetical protein [Chloroflexota bacterium]